MAVKTYYFSRTYGTFGGRFEETEPTLETTGSGWTVGKTAAGNYSNFYFEQERSGSVFTTTPLPTSYDAYAMVVTASPLTGNFAAGDWNIYTRWIAVSNGGALDANIRFWVFYSPSSTGGAPRTMLHSGTLVGSTMTNLATSASQESAVTFSVGAFSITNQYLCVQMALHITGAGSNNNADCLMRVGNEGNGCKMVTTDFSTGLAASGALGTVNVSAPEATAILNDAILKQRTCVGAGI